MEPAEQQDERTHGRRVPAGLARCAGRVREPHPADTYDVGRHHVYEGGEQVEHGADRADDVLPRGRVLHAAAAGPAGAMREQDPDAHQDRAELEDAKPFSAGRVLHAEGARRAGHAFDGARADPGDGQALVQTGFSSSFI